MSVQYVSAGLPDAGEVAELGDFEEFKRIFERFAPAETLMKQEEAEVRGDRCAHCSIHTVTTASILPL